ncbi:TPA: hypothetical protein HA243_04730 [Candidatus Micrarchaeota archaeon]|nr:hypothetical protein [Candidatus Micrarchaeota archaeon]
MKTPIPDDEVKAGALSDESKKRLSEGKITELDFEVAQILHKINERYNISDAEFHKALDLGRAVLILTRGEAGLLIGKQGKIVAELSSALGKKVRIAEIKGDVKKSVADVIMPARLLGINHVFHDGKEMTKVRISKHDLAHLPIDIPTLEKALRSLLEEEVQLVFE